MHGHRWFFAAFAAVCAVLALWSTERLSQAKKPPPPPPDEDGTKVSYRIVKLAEDPLYPDSFPHDVNDAGLIVGVVRDASERALPACWTLTVVNGQVQSSTQHKLLLIGGEDDGGWANSVNDLGQIVGSSAAGTGLYWPDRLAVPLPLPTLSGYTESGATAINANGVICGACVRWVPGEDENGAPILVQESQAAAWRISTSGLFGPVALPSLGNAYAKALNDNDAGGVAEVAGQDSGSAVLWTLQSIEDGKLAASPLPLVLSAQAYAADVNNGSTVCGTNWSEAVVWNGTSVTILARSKFIYSPRALAINDAGQIAGYGDYWRNFTQGTRAVAWPSASGSMIELATFLGRDSEFATLNHAEAINQRGEIVGWGLDAPYDGSSYGAFLAIPQ